MDYPYCISAGWPEFDHRTVVGKRISLFLGDRQKHLRGKGLISAPYHQSSEEKWKEVETKYHKMLTAVDCR